MHDISEGVKVQGVQYGSETWHEYFKSKFLGADELALPNGKTLIRPHSSAELDKGEFADYMTQVEAWAAERGVVMAE